MTEASGPSMDRPGVLDGGEGLPKRFGKYTLLRRVATGGMAELFLALHRSVAGFEKLIVIKRILPSMNSDQGFIDMLLHEARIAATLSHPNVVQIFDVGFAEGAYYIAMEHIHGEDLRSIVHQMKKLRMTEFPLEHALAIVLGMCAGLAYAHEKRGLDDEPLRIVHRDVSPQNVIVTYGGDIKVVDFGIAKSGDGMGEDTRSGRLKGKVPYMSPEQARGEEIDWRSDIFALGIILFELTTGKRLFKGRNELETLRLICDRVYPTPKQVKPGYPLRLDAIVTKALAKDRSERYQSARQMQADLEAYIRQERVAVSTLGLRDWMQKLYGDKLTEQQDALHDLKQLADVIAAQSIVEGGEEPNDSSTSATGYSMAPGPAAAQLPARASTGTNRIAALIAAVLLGGTAAFGGYFLLRTSTPPPPVAAAEPVVPASEQPPAVQYGAVRLVTNPPGASIWIDGALRPEKTPSTIENLPRETPIAIRLTMEGYAPVREDVTLTQEQPVQIERQLVAGTVKVVVRTNAPGAKLFIDDKPCDDFEVEGIVADEEHKVVLSASGYVSKTMRFRSGPNETKEITLNLEREDPSKPKIAAAPEKPVPAPAGQGKLNVSSRGGYCNVMVAGQSRGPTPVGGIVLPAGNHVVTCKPADGTVRSMGVTITPDQTSRITFQLDG